MEPCEKCGGKYAHRIDCPEYRGGGRVLPRTASEVAEGMMREHLGARIHTPAEEWQRVETDLNPRPWANEAPHYQAEGIDIRDVIDAFGLNFNRGAVVKYVLRAGRKPGNDPLMEMKKAREHLNREIARLEAGLPKDPSLPT